LIISSRRASMILNSGSSLACSRATGTCPLRHRAVLVDDVRQDERGIHDVLNFEFHFAVLVKCP
jgi:hypothetical protein